MSLWLVAGLLPAGPAQAGIYPPPDLLIPQAVSVSTPYPAFVWDHDPGAKGFHFLLSRDNDMAQVFADTPTFNNFFRSTTALAQDTTYFWKVTHDVTPEEWSSTLTVHVDFAVPNKGQAQVSMDSGGSWEDLSSVAYYLTSSLSVRLPVQDPVSGLLVSTGLPTGLVGQWHLDESSGIAAMDASTNGFTANLVNSPGLGPGRRGGALVFDGTNQYASIPLHGEMAMIDNFTYEAWVKTTATTRYATILSNQYSYYGLQIGINQSAADSGDVYCYFYNKYQVVTPAQMGFKINDGAWHHIAVVQSGGSTRFFIDGVMRAALSGSPTYATLYPTWIGQWYNYLGSYPMTGSIDEVRVFSVARSTADILADFQSDTAASHDRQKAYTVSYSTNGGRTWILSPTASTSLGGANGTKDSQWLRADGLELVNTTSSFADTNKIAFRASDMAGNVLVATYTVLVDTPPVSIAPPNGAYVFGKPVLRWDGSSSDVQIASNNVFAAPEIDSTTARAVYGSTSALAQSTTYYWRVRQKGLSNWSMVRSFVVEVSTPLVPAPAAPVQISTDSGVTWAELSATTYVPWHAVSARVGVQDLDAGLLVSTGLPTGLVAQWHLDASSGRVALDASPNSYDGVLMGYNANSDKWTAGKKGNALQFASAQSQYVNFPYGAALDMTGAYTIEAWFRTSAGAAYNTIVSHYNSNGYILAIYSDDVRFWSGGWVTWAGLGVNDNTWHHVAVVVSGASAELFLDGISRGSNPITATTTSAQDTRIGQFSGAYFFSGVIDEVKLYNVARSTDEVMADYQSDTAASHDRQKAYTVCYSTDGGRTWVLADTGATSLGGANGTKDSQWLRADGIQLVNTTAPFADTNRVSFRVSDMAGNVSVSTFAVLVDTMAVRSVSTQVFPCDGCYAGAEPNFAWIGPSTAMAAGFGPQGAYLLQVSNNDPNFAPSNLVVSVTTPVVIPSTMAYADETVYVSTYTLPQGATYYWRVAARSTLGGQGPWSQVFSFVRDTDAPGVVTFAHLSSAALARSEDEFNGLLSGATAQVGLQDPVSGMVVSTGPLPNGHGFASGGFGVMLSTDAGQSWITETQSLIQDALVDGVYCMAVYNGKLYAGKGGAADGDGDVLVYDGSGWNVSYAGSKLAIRSLAVHNGKLYAGQSGIAGDGDVFVFDGASWSPSYNGSQEGIYALASHNGRLYAGQGSSADGDGDIYVLEGSTWTQSYSGATLSIYSLASYNGRLYAGRGGTLGGSGDVLIYDAGGWRLLLDNGGTVTGVHALAAHNGKLYAGLGGTAAGDGDVLVYDGSTWQTAYTGAQEQILSLASYNGRLYAGQGSGAGDGDVLHYDGGVWRVLYDGGTQKLHSLAPYNGRLYSGEGGGGTNGAVRVFTPTVESSLSGSDGSIAAQTLLADGLELLFSTNTLTCGGIDPCGATNQVIFHSVDRAGNVRKAGPYALLVSTQVPGVPGNLTALSVTTDVASVGWDASISSHPVVYRLEASTDAAFNGVVYSSVTASTSASLLGLDQNTTYYLHVRGQHVSTGGYSAYLDTCTVSKPLSGAGFASVYPSSVAVSWTPLPAAAQEGSSNSAQGYQVEASTAADFTGTVFMSSTTDAGVGTLPVWGLTRATTYYFRAATLNWPGAKNFIAAGSTMTRTGLAPQGSIGGVFLSSVAVSWASVAADSGYVLQAAMAANFTGTVLSSVTADGASTGLTLQGLYPNTTYYLRAGSIWGKTTAYASVVPASTSTLSNLVVGTAFNILYRTSATVTWTPFPASPRSAGAEGFRLDACLDEDFSGALISSSAWVPTLDRLTLDGLSVDTTYYFRVGSLNSNGVPNYVGMGPKMTAPAAPQSPSIAAAYLSSVAAQWTAVGSKDGYVLEASSNWDFSGAVYSSVTANGAATALVVQGLAPNTTYYLRVGSLRDGTTGYGEMATDSISTFASTVTGTGFQPVTETSAAVQWTPAAAASYRLEASTASNFTGTLFSSATPSAAAAGLSISALTRYTTYYFRVVSLNWAGVESRVVVGSTRTLPGPSVAPSVASVRLSSVTVSWASVSADSGYTLQASTAADFTGIVLSSNTKNGASVGLAVLGLDPNTTYYLRAGSLWNGATVYASAGAACTLARLVSGSSFQSVFLTSATLQWTALPVSPSSESVRGLRVEASTAADFSGTLYSSATRSAGTSSLTVSGLTWSTTYYFRVGSLNWASGVQYAMAGSTMTGTVVSSGTVDNSGPLVITVYPSCPELTLAQVMIPANTFPAGTQIRVNASIPSLPPIQSSQANLTALGPGVAIDISAGGLQPNGPLTIQMTYDPAALPAGTDPRRLVIASYSESSGQWTLLQPVDSATGTVAGVTTHLSLFAPFIATAGTELADLQIYPIPWEPGTGSRFDAANISFTNIPSGAEVELYTMLGELVWEQTAGPSGVVRWDGGLRKGGRAASGTYIVVIRHGGATAKRRVVVIR
ncbi:MAG: LamG-like jellyroll fold domain-containing protein [Elusimicrobiota bacterium]